MTDQENYVRLHNGVVGIYWDAVTFDVSKESIIARLKEAIEESGGITFEQASFLLEG